MRGIPQDETAIAAAVEVALSTGAKGSTVAEIANDFGIGRSTLYRALARARRGEPPVTPAQAAAPRKARRLPKRGATSRAKAKPKAGPRGGGQSPARAAAPLPREPHGPLPEHTEPSTEADDIQLLDQLIADNQAERERLSTGDARRIQLAKAIGVLIKQRHALRPPVGEPVDDEGQRARRADAEVRKLIERYVREWEARCAELGVCLHCEQPVGDGQAARRLTDYDATMRLLTELDIPALAAGREMTMRARVELLAGAMRGGR